MYILGVLINQWLLNYICVAITAGVLIIVDFKILLRMGRKTSAKHSFISP